MIFKKFISFFFFLAYCLLPTANSFSQGTWTQKADFGGGIRTGAIGFSIGNKGYIGTGGDTVSLSYKQDFWEWDQATNVWTQKADFTGIARASAVGFSIGTKGYIGTGQDSISYKQDFWEWDQATNTWSQKSDFGGVIRFGAIGFSIGTKGYIGTGHDNFVSTSYQDFWEWDQATDAWTQKANFGGGIRTHAVGFSIGTKGYIGTGLDLISTPPETKSFWEWDQATNIWTQKANFGGDGRAYAKGFSIGSKGYIGIGYSNNTFLFYSDFWEWNQSTNVWTQKANFNGSTRINAVGFSIGLKGSIGTGYGSISAPPYYVCYQDFWEFDPNGNGIPENEFENSISVYPNPFAKTATLRITNSKATNYEFKLYDVNGTKIKEETIRNSSSYVIRRDNLPGGVYFIHIVSDNKTAIKKLVIQ